MITNRMLLDCLAGEWGLSGASVTGNGDGMNSMTWLVEHCGERFVAKSVPAEARDVFVAGLRVAEILDEAGIPAGPAMETYGDEPVATLDGRPLALLTWVDGDPLDGAGEVEQALAGRTLAKIHTALDGAEVPGAASFDWFRPDAEHLGRRDWLRPAVEGAVDAYQNLRPSTLTWGILHGDPAPEAFRRDPESGLCGLIDWGSVIHGPLLYDLASAVMYVGGWERRDPIVRAYLEAGPLSSAEVERGLATMLRLRWAVQADYFARRIAAGDLTGIEDASGNEKGLEDARRALAGHRM